MPIYEFQCDACGKESEALVRSTQWKGTPCPHCGSKRLSKQLSVFAPAPGTEDATAPECTGNPSGCGRCSPGTG